MTRPAPACSRPCETCGGLGVISPTTWDFDGDSDRMLPVCTEVEPCEECGGTGVEDDAAEPGA